MRLMSPRTVATVVFCLAIAACGERRVDASNAQTAVAFESCRLKGVEYALRCASIDVPEDRAAAAGPHARRIAIRVAVVPALASKPEPDAVFVVAGGPGQAATDVAALVVPMLSKLNRSRDLVFVDQRGTGGSNALSCGEETAGDGLADAFDPDRSGGVGTRAAHCAARLAAKADLRFYTTPIAMQDLDAVRARLGYPTIDLWAASYGTRAALEYARQFPDRIRTMTLDGVAPAWRKLPLAFGVDTHAAIVAIVAACAHDADCAKRHPHLGEDIASLFAKLSAGPVRADVTNPVTGRRETVAIAASGFAQMLRVPLYTGLTAALLPAAVDAALHDDFDALAALGFTIASGIDDHLALGMHLSVVCSEDVAAISDADVAAAHAEAARSVVDGRPNPFATMFVDQYRQLCASWPRGTVPAAYFEPLTGKPGANVPTLLLSGGIDPATPPADAAVVAKTLTHARHLVAPNIGHGVSINGCAPDLIERFVRTADPSAIDGACLAAIPRPPFFAPIDDGPRDRTTGVVP